VVHFQGSSTQRVSNQTPQFLWLSGFITVRHAWLMMSRIMSSDPPAGILPGSHQTDSM